MKKGNIEKKWMKWIRRLDDWNLYKVINKNLFVVRLPDGTTQDFNTRKKAEKFMLYGFYKDLGSND